MQEVFAWIAGHWQRAALLSPDPHGGYRVLQAGGAVAWAGAVATEPDWDDLPDDAPGHDDPEDGPQE